MWCNGKVLKDTIKRIRIPSSLLRIYLAGELKKSLSIYRIRRGNPTPGLKKKHGLGRFEVRLSKQRQYYVR